MTIKTPSVDPKDLSWFYTKVRETSPKGCYWPMWDKDPGPNPQFCNKPRLPGESYCQHHYDISYVRAKKHWKPI